MSENSKIERITTMPTDNEREAYLTSEQLRTIEHAATKLENIGHIFAGDKESRRLAKELKAILAATPSPTVTVDAEPVYQVETSPNGWTDVTADQYDASQLKCRIVYTAPAIPVPNSPVEQHILDYCWRMYQQGLISADHTAKQVFEQTLQSLAVWLAKLHAATTLSAAAPSQDGIDLCERIIAAIKGECDGLAITEQQASNILAYLQYGAPMCDMPEAFRIVDNAIGSAEEHSPDGGDLRIVTLRMDKARKVRAALSAPADGGALTEPEWIVNDLGELGVKIGGRCFFLYKGDNIEYDGTHDDGTPMLYRMVGKREFGEVQYPDAWLRAGRREDRYTVNLVYHEGLSFGKPEDGDWKPLPASTKAEGL